MRHDPHLVRFMGYLSLFTFFMLILITSSNFVQLFVGWEGVGVSSFLLINFWYTRIQANKSAIKAMLINKIGDIFLLFAILFIVYSCDSVDFDVVFSLVTKLEETNVYTGFGIFSILDLICLFLFLGAVGKSAQLGLHSWLPDAMEGPTPVSALIHAATMVTAGIFLVVRCSFLFEYSPQVLNFIVVVGALTAFFAATIGLFQNDIKRVIAYSTCSQLGYMTFACGFSCYDVALFHLFNHAFFKALLFLSAGSVIHAIGDQQDMRKMGGLKQVLPFSYAMVVIGSLALTGFPFLAGFYSKDTILESAFSTFTTTGHFAYILGTLAAFCTAFYSVRLIALVFLNDSNGTRINITNAHEGSWLMTLPLFILSFLSISVGFFFRDIFLGMGSPFWANAIFVLPINNIIIDSEFLDLKFKLLPLGLSLFGGFLAAILYLFGLKNLFALKQKSLIRLYYIFFNRKWLFDKLVNEILCAPSLSLSYNYFYCTVDRGLLERVGPLGIIKTLQFLILSVKNLQTGYIYTYIILFFFAIYLFFIILIITPFSLTFLFFLLCLSFFFEF